MREIKFRALKYDMSSRSFAYGSLIYSELGFPMIQENPKQMFLNSCIKGTEGQFTGLKDKNGVEIYEGDIMVHPVYKKKSFIVKFEHDAYSFVGHNGHEWVYLDEFRNGEKLGDIYQNTELL